MAAGFAAHAREAELGKATLEKGAQLALQEAWNHPIALSSLG